MTTTTEKLAKKALIPSLFRGFPSWSGKVTLALIEEYLEYVEDVSAEAVKRAIKAFRSGGIDRDNGFPVTGPELAAEARKHQVEIDVEEFWDKTDFIEVGTAEWKGLCQARKVKSMPSIEYKGPRRELHGSMGWYVDKGDVAKAAKFIADHRKEMARIEKRGPLKLTAPVRRA